MNKYTAVAASLVLLSGCSMMPEYQRPELPLSSIWSEKAHFATPQKFSQTSWQEYFPDPRLQALINTALENNRDLRIATARIAEARALYGVQQADRLPNVNLAASRSASRTPAGASITGSAMSTQRYDVAVSLVSFELDFWGRVSSLNTAAKNSYLATEAAQRTFRLSLISDVANAYLSVLELRERARLANDTVNGRKETRDLVKRRREVGVASELDYLQAEGIYQASIADRANLTQQQTAASNLLDLLLGQSVASIKALPDGRDLSGQEIKSNLLAGLPSDELLTRPDVQAAEYRLIAANANIGAARAAFFPRISLTGSAGTASGSLSGLFDAGSGAWSFQPALVQPLFDAGRNSANVDLAKARKVLAVADYERIIQQAFREVADLLSARNTIKEQLAAQQANADVQNQRLKLVEARYQAGVANHLEVLDAQRDAFAAEQGALQTRRLSLAIATQLYKALGADFTDAPRPATQVSAIK
ncbi:MAG: efflux transporter outer membrane subunit [Gallionella sp.]